MTRAAHITLTLILLISAVVRLQAQSGNTQDSIQIAQEEAVRRQAATLRLHFKLAEAQAAQKSNRLAESAKLYQEAVGLIPSAQVGNPAVEAEKKQAVAGLVSVRTTLARQAQNRGQMAEANEQVNAALKADPANESLRQLKAEIDRVAAERQGSVPSPDLVKTIPAVQKEKIDVATQVQNAKLLYEMGKYDESEAILKEVVKKDPSNRPAYYYLDLLKEARYMNKAKAREAAAKSALVRVEDAWIPPTKQEALPTPNSYATTNLVFTTKGRQEIISKLDRIRLNEVSYDLPLSEVLKLLRDESRKRDPEQTGINFLINPHADSVVVSSPVIDPTAAANGAMPQPVAPAPAVDLSQVTIRISPPLNNLRLADVLDVITKVADVPIKFTIEDYAVMFSPKPPEAVQLFSKTFRVDPNTFVQGLESVTSVSMGDLGSSGGGGGRGGGGGSGGDTASFIDIPRVVVAGGGGSSRRGGGGGISGGGGSGLSFLTRTNSTSGLHEMVRQYFTAAGVTLTDPGKVVFFNDRLGTLYVRASLQDLEIIEAAVETLNQAPPQLSIETKFAEFSQDDSRALGFDWFLGNFLINHGSIGTQAGTAPSYAGRSSAANPSGFFPGPGVQNEAGGPYVAGPGTIPASGADNILTSGLRQTAGNDSVPAVATITGILTDPQFRVVIRALEQRSGSDLLQAPKVTTLSGRQAHVSVLDLVQVVTGVDLQQTSSGGGGGINGGGGNGVIGSFSNYETESMPFGPVLDVMPTVSADGYSIQMVLIPTITEFLGYDNPGQFVPQAQSVSGSLGIPLTAVLPLPRLRMRQVVTTCNVWDGQTVVLGGLISENIKKIKDKVPVLGDIPFVGRLFRSESSATSKKNLMVFVTPTIIDPAGNRLHSDEEMPFARNSIPSQPQSGPRAAAQ